MQAASDKAEVGDCSGGDGRLSRGERRELSGKGQGGFDATALEGGRIGVEREAFVEAQGVMRQGCAPRVMWWGGALPVGVEGDGPVGGLLGGAAF